MSQKMPTIRQKRLAEAIVNNGLREQPLNKAELVVSAGYAEMTAKANAGFIIDQPGVQEALDDLGFTEENAKKVVVKILLEGKEESAQLKAADMVFKVKGSYAPEKSQNVNLNVKAEAKDLTKHEQLRTEYEEKLRRAYLEE